ncbi:cellulose binding domain-containing protein [Acrocarpospora corrugata]|nr:cellulose binding domain-containing protein [Acrocarpospora corrugata]
MASTWAKSKIAIVLVGAAVALPLPAHATPAFSCAYRFVAWTGSFNAELAITNNGPAINSWRAHWTFSTATTNLVGWQAKLHQQTPYDLTASNMPWNGTIPSGGVTTFGWTAFAVTTAAPTDITVNGIPC